MKRIFAALLAISVCISLAACTLCKPQTTDETPGVQAPPSSPVPDPVPPVISGENKVESVGELLDYPAASVRISRPAVRLENQSAAEIINNYYTLLSAKVKDYVEGDLTPNPMTEEYFTVTAEYTVTYFAENRLSILWEVTTASSLQTPFATAVSAASFDTQTGNLLTFDALFGKNATAVQGKFVQKARNDIGILAEEHYYYENWWDLAETALEPDDFYLSQEGITVFYSREKLGTYTEILLTWESLEGLMA